MKIPGESCPYCSLKYCTHRCDNCDEHFNWPMYLNDGRLNRNPKTGRMYPVDDNGKVHDNCMGGGTRDRKWHGPHLRQEAKQERSDLAEYLSHKLVLGPDNWWWHKYHDGKYAGRHSKATYEEIASGWKEVEQRTK